MTSTAGRVTEPRPRIVPRGLGASSRATLLRVTSSTRYACLLALLTSACGSSPTAGVEAPVPEQAPAEADAPGAWTAQRLARSGEGYDSTATGFCSIDAAERVVCWGAAWGVAPRTVEGLDDAVEVVATPTHVCARRRSGEVACSRRGGGDAEVVLEDTVDVAALGYELCAVTRAGEVTCWGGPWSEDHPSWRRFRGAVERSHAMAGTPETWRRRARLDGLTDAVALRASGPAAAPRWCALRRSGAVTCWGVDEEAGPLEGIGDALDLTLAGPAPCVLRRAGGVVCEEAAAPGETSMWRAIPQSSDARAFVRGAPLRDAEVCARVAAGDLACWHADDRFTPPLPEGLTDLTEVAPVREPDAVRGAARADGLPEAGCAATPRGPWCWGPLAAAGRAPEAARGPVAPVGLSDVVELTAGDWHTCARRRSGEILCWGRNAYQALGEPTYDPRAEDAVPAVASPTPLATPEGARVFAGATDVCAVDARGRVACRGQVAHAMEAGGAAPDDGWVPAVGLTAPERLVTGVYTLCGLRRSRVSCAGRDVRQPGPQPLEVPNRFAPLAALGPAVDLSAYANQICAAGRDGRVRCVGSYVVGRRGDARAAMELPAIRGATRVLLGERRVWVLAEGHVRALAEEAEPPFASLEEGDGWWYGELPGIDDAVDLTPSCALRDGGAVVCWGWLARLLGAETFHPVTVPLEGAATQLVGAPGHACALLDNGQVRCWGDDRFEQLGDGPAARWLDTPVAVDGEWTGG